MRDFPVAILLFVAASFTFSELAKADDKWNWNLDEVPSDSQTWLVLAGKSHHWRTGEHHYNESNYGVGMEHVLPNHASVYVGAYDNSFHHTSSYAAYGPRLWGVRLWGTVDLESRLMLGVITGYGDNENQRDRPGLLIMPVLTLRSPEHGVGIAIVGVPGLLLGLTVEVRLP